uniref:HECT domain-containing protein n=1 Tax=Sparus aurata TaxID=8175 RepID=A0A671VS74_SPAAU
MNWPLMQAGLGKRTVSFDSDLTHVEVCRSDHVVVVKMSAIPLEAEGYTGAMLQNVSGGGKSILYIVPLQDELDLSPLPPNAPEFALMPKASCKHCFAEISLQMLALHDRKCASHTRPDLETPEFLHRDKYISVCLSIQEEDVRCPIYGIFFPVLLIEEHASHCGQRCGIFHSEEDVIMWLKSKVDTSKTFELCVSRDNMLERGLKLWKHNKKATPLNRLWIKFLGEAVIDTGALRKEFLTTMVSGIEQCLFEVGKSKMPKYSVNDFDEELFRIAVEIFATSIAQGGPAPRFLQRAALDHLFIIPWYVLSSFLLLLQVHYITSHLALEMSERAVPSVQWITGQAHRHLLSDRQNFKITVRFDHDCHKMPNHTICYPTVSACTDTITFPVAHMSDYGSFKNVMTTAIKYGVGF